MRLGKQSHWEFAACWNRSAIEHGIEHSSRERNSTVLTRQWLVSTVEAFESFLTGVDEMDADDELPVYDSLEPDRLLFCGERLDDFDEAAVVALDLLVVRWSL